MQNTEVLLIFAIALDIPAGIILTPLLFFFFLLKVISPAPILCLAPTGFIDGGCEQIVPFIRNEFTTF